MVERESRFLERLPPEVNELYGPYLNKVCFLSDCAPFEGLPGVNWNQIQAFGSALALIEDICEFSSPKGINIGLLGTMGAGKTTTVCLLACHFKGLEPRVYKHSLDAGRTGRDLRNHSGGIATRATLYKDLGDIGNGDDPFLLVDELQFSQDPSGKLAEFLTQRRARGLITVVSQLDFDFRREPWPNVRELLPCLDRILVLQARCEDCGRPAFFPQRNVNGQPARVDDPVIMVGAEELYQSKCGQCHQVRWKL